MFPINTMSKGKIIQYDIVPLICINCTINIEKLNEMMVFIFKKYCTLSIYGYNVETNKFWGKKFQKECNLHFTLTIKKNVDFTSTIVIDTIYNKNNELNKLHEGILKAIHAYNSYTVLE